MSQQILQYGIVKLLHIKDTLISLCVIEVNAQVI